MEAFIDAVTEAGFFIPRRMAPDLLYQWIEGVQKHDDENETNYHRILDLLRYLEPKDLFVFLETVYSDPDRIDEDITEAVSELTLQMCESGEFNDEDLIRAAYPYQVCLFDDPDLTFERLRELVLLVGQQEKYHPIGFDGYNALITYCSIEMLHKLGFENMRQLIIDVVGDEECGVFFEWNYKHKFDENNPVVQWAFLYCAFDDLKEFIAENDDEDEANESPLSIDSAQGKKTLEGLIANYEIYKTCHAANVLFAYGTLIGDGFFVPVDDERAMRFFRIFGALHLDMQMMLCHRTVGSPKSSIKSVDLKIIARQLLSA